MPCRQGGEAWRARCPGLTAKKNDREAAITDALANGTRVPLFALLAAARGFP